MAKGDYYRPAGYQINKIYRCEKCGDEQEVGYGMSASMPCRYCRGYVSCVGESYPASADDWDELKDKSGNWHNRNNFY